MGGRRGECLRCARVACGPLHEAARGSPRSAIVTSLARDVHAQQAWQALRCLSVSASIVGARRTCGVDMCSDRHVTVQGQLARAVGRPHRDAPTLRSRRSGCATYPTLAARPSFCRRPEPPARHRALTSLAPIARVLCDLCTCARACVQHCSCRIFGEHQTAIASTLLSLSHWRAQGRAPFAASALPAPLARPAAACSSQRRIRECPTHRSSAHARHVTFC